MKFPFKGMTAPAVSITKPVYAMATTDGQSAEITMYGDIYETQPVDWWTGEPIEGQFVLLSEFMDDLEKIAKCKDITIRMNSYGGDAVVAITIHNRLRELVREGAKLTCVVDGVAMSGGSLIMCACDTVKVNPSSLIMIHKCWATVWGGYNADQLRELASTYDAYDKAQISIYKRKCGLSDTKIAHMMGETTYMTGAEAVEKGFADELMDDAEPLDIAASADGRALVFRGRQVHLAPGMFVPDNIPTVTSEASATVETNNTLLASASEEGGTDMTPEELRAQYPEAVAQLEAEARAAVSNDDGTPAPPAVPADPNPAAPDTPETPDAAEAERRRIQDIDAVAHLFPAAVVQEAKYGPNACNAQEMAYRAAQQAAKTGGQFLAALDADAADSGAQGVGAAATTPADDNAGNNTPEQKMASARAQVKGLLGKKED